MTATTRTAKRDVIVCWLVNRLLRFATPWYRNMVAGAIHYGLDAAARDTIEQRPAPPPWQSLDLVFDFTTGTVRQRDV